MRSRAGERNRPAQRPPKGVGGRVNKNNYGAISGVPPFSAWTQNLDLARQTGGGMILMQDVFVMLPAGAGCLVANR